MRALQIIFLLFWIVVAASAQSADEQLFRAVYESDSAKAASWIEKGSDVNAQTYDGFTPLMYAADIGHTGIAELLVKHGAKPNLRSGDGRTALILSILAGNIATSEFLIRNGADIDMADASGVSPLMHAVMVDSFYLPDMLLYYGADVNHSDNNGMNALMLSALYGNYEIAVRLLETGSEINNSDSTGNTALHYAISSGNTELMDLLILNGALIDIKNKAGYTPLAAAVSGNDYDAAKLLLGYGADVNTRIRRSLNILSIATANRNDSMRRLLLNNDAEILWRPNFDTFSTGAGFALNSEDLRITFDLGLTDSRFHLMPSVQYGFRPAAVRVLRSEDHVLYQYHERRHFLSAGLSKGFFIRESGKKITTAAYAGISGTLTFGSYRGSSSKPDPGLRVSPRIGCIFQYTPFRVMVGYEFLNLHLKYYDSGWFSISMQFLLNTRKKSISTL